MSKLMHAADAIVTGVVSTREPRPGILRITVDKVYKGRVRVRQTITAGYELTTAGEPYPKPKADRGLHFLSKAKDGRWRILSRTSGYQPDARELYFVLANPPRSPIGIPAALRPSLHDWLVTEIVAARLAGVFSGVVDYGPRSNPSPAMRWLFRRLRDSTDPVLHRIAFRAAILDGDVRALQTLAESHSTFEPTYLRTVAEDLGSYSKVGDKATVAELGRILAPSMPLVLRDAAATALTRVHNRYTLPHLAGLLVSQDVRHRWMGVQGLGRFANEDAVGASKYRSEETLRYGRVDSYMVQTDPTILVFWRSWWDRYRRRLTAGL
jgi:hypothetical protein